MNSPSGHWNLFAFCQLSVKADGLQNVCKWNFIFCFVLIYGIMVDYLTFCDLKTIIIFKVKHLVSVAWDILHKSRSSQLA